MILWHDGRLLNKIPAKYITEDFYAKLEKLSPFEQNSSFMRVCGKVTGRFNGLKHLGYKINASFSTKEFTVVDKPIELYKTGSKTPYLTIPLSWYNN